MPVWSLRATQDPVTYSLFLFLFCFPTFKTFLKRKSSLGLQAVSKQAAGLLKACGVLSADPCSSVTSDEKGYED